VRCNSRSVIGPVPFKLGNYMSTHMRYTRWLYANLIKMIFTSRDLTELPELHTIIRLCHQRPTARFLAQETLKLVRAFLRTGNFM